MEFQQHILDSLEHLNAQCASMKEAVNSLDKNQRKLFDIVANGNGQPSVLSQLASIRAQLNAVEERETQCRAEVFATIHKRKAPATSYGKIGIIIGAIVAGAASVWQLFRG